MGRVLCSALGKLCSQEHRLLVLWRKSVGMSEGLLGGLHPAPKALLPPCTSPAPEPPRRQHESGEGAAGGASARARLSWRPPVACFAGAVGPLERRAPRGILEPTWSVPHNVTPTLHCSVRAEAQAVQGGVREASAFVPPRDDWLRDRPPPLLPLRGVQIPGRGFPFPEGSKSRLPAAAPPGLWLSR